MDTKEQKDISAEDKKAKAQNGKEHQRYNLRLCSQVNRVLVERRKEEPKKPKPKSRPPPLSKYRRKTANCRERSRMNEINQAFEDLKDVIPDYPSGKMTKITTLRLAMNYMAALREMLGQSNETSASGSQSSLGSPSSDESACSASENSRNEGYRSISVASPETSSSSDGGSTGSISDCSSPEPCVKNLGFPQPHSLFDNTLSDSMDIDTDASLNQLFDLKLDNSLNTSLDTSIDEVFSPSHCNSSPREDLSSVFAT